MADVEAEAMVLSVEIDEDSENSEVLELNLRHAHGPSMTRCIAKIPFTILVGFALAIFFFAGAKTALESTSMTLQNKGNVGSINTNNGGAWHNLPLELDSSDTTAWNNLGNRGGGVVLGKHYYSTFMWPGVFVWLGVLPLACL